MAHLNVTFLNLPDLPHLRIHRHYAGGFGIVERIRGGPGPGRTVTTLMPPIFSAVAAAQAEGMGLSASMVDCQAEGLDREGMCGRVEETNPDVLVTRISLPALEADSASASDLSTLLPDVKTIVWGPVAKIFSDRVLGIPGVHACLDGELEFSLPGLLSALSQSREISGVPGVITMTNSGPSSVPPPPAENLDDLPLPAHHLMDMSNYVAEGVKFRSEGDGSSEPFYAMLTSRGCNFGCIYCPYRVSFPGGWRGMSPERVLEEVEELVSEHGIRNIWFLDQVFTQDEERARRICEALIEKDLGVRWNCETRADKLPRWLLDLMKKAGCGRLQVGVETGDPKLQHLGKPGLGPGDVQRTFKDLKEVGIVARASLMVGLPGDGWESVRLTEELIETIKPDLLEVGISTPYPGTPFFDEAREKNWIVDEDFSHYTISDPVTSFPGFSATDMARARRYLLDRFMIRSRLRGSLGAVKSGRLDVVARNWFPRRLGESLRRVENLVRVRGKV